MCRYLMLSYGEKLLQLNLEDIGKYPIANAMQKNYR